MGQREDISVAGFLKNGLGPHYRHESLLGFGRMEDTSMEQFLKNVLDHIVGMRIPHRIEEEIGFAQLGIRSKQSSSGIVSFFTTSIAIGYG